MPAEPCGDYCNSCEAVLSATDMQASFERAGLPQAGALARVLAPEAGECQDTKVTWVHRQLRDLQLEIKVDTTLREPPWRAIAHNLCLLYYMPPVSHFSAR